MIAFAALLFLSLSNSARAEGDRCVPGVGCSKRPGPSADLHAAPFYVCKRNFYVSANGSDGNPGTKELPWRTIQRADHPTRAAGDCINVAPGLYKANVLIRFGGTEPTPQGYVVYRCEVLNACHVLAPGQGYLWGFTAKGSFAVVDGFEIDGNDALAPHGVASACLGSDDQTFGKGNSAHHVWILNNIIHHCNLSGVSLAWKEWYYVLHNKVYHNSYTSGYQGSGISFVVLRCIEAKNADCYGDSSYVPSGMDLTYLPPFHNVVARNVVFDNGIGPTNPVPCGAHTDGNGIIMDTFFDETEKIAYPYRSLVFGNVSYSNGGRGVHVFRASNITVSNNTAFGNGKDTCIDANYLADLSQAGGQNNVWINNIAQSVMTDPNPRCGRLCGNRNAPIVAGDAAGIVSANTTWANNIAFGAHGVKLFDKDAQVPYFSCSNNLCDTDPMLVDAGRGNFALRPGSPAINYGRPHLPLATPDAGACASSLSTCP